VNLICPGCAGRYSIDAYLADDAARRCIKLAAELPAPLADLALRYLTLFRPAQRALLWPRAYTLLSELVTAIQAGQIERHGRTWSAPVSAWHDALEDMLGKRDSLNLPLKGHGYLYEIIAGRANQVEAATEQKTERRRQTGKHRPAEPQTTKRSDPVAAREHLGKVMSKIRGASGE